MLESLGEKDRRRLWLLSIVTAGLAGRGLAALSTRFDTPIFELVQVIIAPKSMPQ